MRTLAITAVVLVAVSVAFWQPLAAPSRFLATALPLGAFLAPIALASITFVFRRAIGSFLRRANDWIPARARFIVAPLVATVFFAVSWAGSHFGHETDLGILPQIAFPAVSGVFAFSVARYGQALQHRAGGYFSARDRVGTRWRFVLLIVLTAAASYVLGRLLGTSASAFNQQLLVVIGMLAGYLLLAPGLTRPTAAEE